MNKGIITASVIGGAALIYIEASFLMVGRFPFRTSINGTDVSLEKFSAAQEKEQKKADGYTLQILKRNGQTAEISGSSIDLHTYYNEEEMNKAESRSFLTWPASLVFPADHTVSTCIDYSEDELSKAVDALELSTKDPSDLDNMLDEELTKEAIGRAVSELQTTVDLEANGCYLSQADALERQKQMVFDNVLASYDDYQISIPISDGVTLDTDTIKSWIHEPEEGPLDVQEQEAADSSENSAGVSNIEIEGGNGAYFAIDSIAAYVEELAEKYNTYGEPHTFKTHGGETIELTLGDYGWWLNQGETREAIVNALKNKETSIEPVFYQKAAQWPSEENNYDDIGNTYAEVDLDSQHVWMWKDGEVVWESDCVSGNASAGNGTPDGVYSIKLKQVHAVLRGEGYASPVNYWMPFNLGIGFHDASWRSSFGGDIYTNSGSHGCINLPSSKVEEFYNTISTGDPVIVYGGLSQEEARSLTSHTGGTYSEAAGTYTPPAAVTQTPAQDAVIPDAVTPAPDAIDPVTGAVIPSIAGDQTGLTGTDQTQSAAGAAASAAGQAAASSGTASSDAADSPEAIQAQIQADAEKIAADMYNQQIAAGASNEDAIAAAQKTAESYVSQSAQQ